MPCAARIERALCGSGGVTSPSWVVGYEKTPFSQDLLPGRSRGQQRLTPALPDVQLGAGGGAGAGDVASLGPVSPWGPAHLQVGPLNTSGMI